MWMVFGAIAIIFAGLNIVWMIRRLETKWFRFISLSFTALTLCAFYSLAKSWVLTSQADQLLDVMPTLSLVLWALTIASIIINGISVFANKQR
jgi:hypothetical protein